jgi:hypothetical protein
MLSWKWCQGSGTDPNIRYMEDIWPHQLKHPMVKIVLWWLISEKHASERPAEPSLDVREVHRHEKRAPIGRLPQTLVQTSEVCLEIVLWVCVVSHSQEKMTPSAYGQLWEFLTIHPHAHTNTCMLSITYWHNWCTRTCGCIMIYNR